MHSFSTSAAEFTSRDDLIKRASLLFDDFIIGSGYPYAFNDLKKNIQDVFSELELKRWEEQINQSPFSLDLIKKFSRVEGSTELPGAKGQGRMSGKAFPRMGWTLIKATRKSAVPSTEIINMVELTVHAGYLSSVLLFEKLADRPFRSDPEVVYEKFIMQAYMTPENAVQEIWEFTSFQRYWEFFLKERNLQKPLRDLQSMRRKSPFVNSFSGLVGVGIALAVAERVEKPEFLN